MAKIQGPRPRTHWLMLQTPDQVRYVAKLYMRLGYKYLVGWRDVSGWGLHVVQLAEWQSPSSAPYFNF